MTGVRRHLAALLAAAVVIFLFLPSAGAHTLSDSHGHFEVLLNGSRTLTVTEGQSATVTVRVRCTQTC